MAAEVMRWDVFPSDNSNAHVRRWLIGQLDSFVQREAAQVADAMIRMLDDRSRAVLDAVDRRFSEAELNRLAGWLERIRLGEPLQYVLGSTDFCGLRLACSAAALIPRPETEELVGWALEQAGADCTRVLDVGTGTGCIALALKAARPHWSVTAWDVSEAALELAVENGRTTGLNVDWQRVDLLADPVSDSWDLICSNPPYIPERERERMARHVVDHEPGLALFVPDEDPLVFYTALSELALKSLNDGGSLIAECHFEKAEEVANCWRKMGWEVHIRVDMQGAPRAVCACMKSTHGESI